MDRFTAPFRGGVAAAFTALSVALVSVFSAPAALAQSEAAADIYIGVTPTAGEPVLVYVMSDSAAPGVQERATYALTIAEGSRELSEFTPEAVCRIVTSYSLQEAVSNNALILSRQPVYGPNAEQKIVAAPDFPLFMSRESARTLLNNGVFEQEAELTPFFNCAGWFWAVMVKQPPEFWDRTFKELIEAERAKQN